MSKSLDKIRYKNFKFPNNPETTSFKCDRSYIKHKYPELVGNELEDFGVNAIVITGSGYFFGNDAYDTFKKLYSEYMKGGVGDFSHPIFTQVTRGLMTNLECNVGAEVNAVRYSFEVIADSEPNIVEGFERYVVTEVNASYSTNSNYTATPSYKVGDIVNFKGGKHYSSSYGNAQVYSARAGQAKITLGPDCKGNGGVHPWHLVHTDSKSNVCGWVDEGTFE